MLFGWVETFRRPWRTFEGTLCSFSTIIIITIDFLSSIAFVTQMAGVLQSECRRLGASVWLRRGFLERHFATARACVQNDAQVMLVESPAKAKKIQEFLGGAFKVLASYGHVRDLSPKSGSVQPEQNFEMRWETLRNAEKHIKILQDVLAQSDQATTVLYMATDPDREGEAISWHMIQELQHRGALSRVDKVLRVSFTEITKPAVLHALEEPREIDEKIVQAYLARRALDYLLGFHLSPILWRKLPGAASAGRVQSVALRMVCEREEEIESFNQALYWTVHGLVGLEGGSHVQADLVKYLREPVPKAGYSSEEEALKISHLIQNSKFVVKAVSERKTSRQPSGPFTTSTLQQEANKTLGFGATKTMQLAQELYEGGLITYMRTDSLAISNSAIEKIQDALQNAFGEEFVSTSPRTYHTRKGARSQEAHEAIRPTDPLTSPHSVSHKGYSPAAVTLYEMIRSRALASQSTNAISSSVQVIFQSTDGNLELKATASKTEFPGYLVVLEREEEVKDSIPAYNNLAALKEGAVVDVLSSSAQEHATKPPPRYTEGSLVKQMEEYGIGRPSTYAPTLKLLYARNYIKSTRNRLHAEPIGRILTCFLKEYAPEYVDYEFTSNLEQSFDRISHGEEDWKKVMQRFWVEFEQTTCELSNLSGTTVLDKINKDLSNYLFRGKLDSITGDPEGGTQCPKCKEQLSLKLSHKGGPFIGCSSYPECSYTRSLPTHDDDYIPTAVEDLGNAFKSMNVAEKFGMRGPVRLLGTHPESNLEIFVRQGPYGPYIQLGTDKDPGMKRVPLPKDSKPRSLTLKYALSMLTLPKILGSHPETSAPVEIRNGKFGPFILHGNQMRSIPKDVDPLEMTLDDGLVLLRLSSENKKFVKQPSHSNPVSIEAPTRKFGPQIPSSTIPRVRSAYQFFLKGMIVVLQSFHN